MTRINVVEPSELCDEHLRAEYRELTRIPNAVASGKLSDHSKIPPEYKLGTGHVYFFADKLGWLFKRYQVLGDEMRKRGFKAEWRWPEGIKPMNPDYKYYYPTEHALKINRERIKERWPKNAHYCGVKV